MDFSQFFPDSVMQKLVNSVSEQVGIPKSTSRNLVDIAVPLFVNGLANNSADKNEAQHISDALKEDHDGSILADVEKNAGSEEIKIDGGKIVEHILGSKQDAAVDLIGNSTGINAGQVRDVLSIVAPFVMGAIGKEQKTIGYGLNDVASLLSMLAGSENTPQLVANILDRNKNGNFLDDLISFVRRLFGKQDR